jgi:hypothetical protein
MMQHRLEPIHKQITHKRDSIASNKKSTVSFGLLNIGEWLLSTSRKVTEAPASFAACAKALCAWIGDATFSEVARYQTATSN